MSHYGSKFVKCPYYHNHDNNRIVCEGLSKGNTINLVYESQVQKEIFMQEKCNSIEGCRRCQIHNLLDRKWENR